MLANDGKQQQHKKGELGKAWRWKKEKKPLLLLIAENERTNG